MSDFAYRVGCAIGRFLAFLVMLVVIAVIVMIVTFVWLIWPFWGLVLFAGIMIFLIFMGWLESRE